MDLINTKLLGHPLNWVIVWTVLYGLVLALAAIHVRVFASDLSVPVTN